MEIPKIFESEYRFCLILWEHEPVNSTKLVELCRNQLDWSKATTYTVIRRLSERGVLKNENATVTSLISKEQAQASRLEEMVEETFEGSIPAFIAAFSRSRKLTKQEVQELRQLIDDYGEG
jgi:predicted transcriptional regulator